MKWNPKTKTPRRKGWYITMRCEDGYVSWRAWGNGEWWKQSSGGWIGWYDGDGNPYRCLWLSKPYFSIEINQNELPPVENYTKPKKGAAVSTEISDGFGNSWTKCKLAGDCGLHIVRPGKADCWCYDCDESKGRVGELIADIDQLEAYIVALEDECTPEQLREARKAVQP